ncbi:MAG: NADP-dependent malic enzyme [Proteobacteria bacterium]|nr:NADP-dependent malic enzyme [Pseudomonadota bacterium]
MSDDLREAALEYHRTPKPGKIGIHPTKPLDNQRDLALAYTPGVAAACEEIARDPAEAYSLTCRANLVAVVTNGTAVLGLGPIGALASKPVMEGKAVLFKKFAGIDVFDIEINETDPDKLVEIIASLEPTFGAINLEDIKAPECFEIEQKLKARLNIPVFHDDQHGTAICVGAAVLNGLRLIEKDIARVKIVTSGAGAAAIACLDLLVSLGAKHENILVCDRKGVVFKDREKELDPEKARFAAATNARTLADALTDSDIFLGLSGAGVVSREMVATMAPRPLILALANPDPEILPEEVRAVRSDAIIATGRSDYPNQVNNVLCFPFIFRGALDVGAREINTEMKLACVHANADIARAEASDVVAAAYGDEPLKFGPDYILPKPFDPRLITAVPLAVAEAAVKSGVAARPFTDLEAYRVELSQRVFRTGYLMRTVFDRAKHNPKRLVYAEGEEERVLHAVQIVVDEGLVRPILIGRRAIVEEKIVSLGLRLKVDRDLELLDPQENPNLDGFRDGYHRLLGRAGVSPGLADEMMRMRPTAIAAMMVRRGDADAMLAGPIGRYQDHLRHIVQIIGVKPDLRSTAAMLVLVLEKGVFFMTDTHVNDNPDAEQIAQISLLAAEQVRSFGIRPKLALLSSSNFGSNNFTNPVKMRRAVELINAMAPELEVEGEMHADVALDERLRREVFPNSRLEGAANLLVMPNLDAANIAFNIVRVLGNGLTIGPILLGLESPAHVLFDSSSVRGIMNLSAFAGVQATAQAVDSQLALSLLESGE